DEAGPKENGGCPDQDGDGDGVFDRVDQCVKEGEDKDGYEDADGCPDPDNDGDTVLDATDACPLVKGAAELKGCPDQDGDGLIDSQDSCPAIKGPKENKGCADGDKDGDTVIDRLDRCPDVAGDKNNAGCAWPDGDGDTVADRFDNCPTEAGPATNSGCPDKVKQLVVITSDKLIIKDKVYFETNKAALMTKSNALLVQVAAVLVAHPEIKLLQIEGHTDTTGDAAFNTALSGERAEAVKDFLVKRGVDAARLKAVGFGPEKPADTNDTPAGRENNRRVEFNIIGQ
ncbi:MAG: OmpA family protein, partial [Archangium sp.]|nr:OmpA family protein [Archangium sp.]